MANIVELAADQSPPKGGYWAMVVINEADSTVGEPTIRHTMGATFYTSMPQSIGPSPGRWHGLTCVGLSSYTCVGWARASGLIDDRR